MSRFRTSVVIPTAILVCGFAIPSFAQSPTDAELREAAEKILAGDEYQHFNHFERTPKTEPVPSQPAPETKEVVPSEEPAPAERPWWERARQRRRSKTGSSRGTESRSAESSSSQSSDQSSDRGNAAPSSNTSEKKSTQSKSGDSSNSEKPTPTNTDSSKPGDASRPQREPAQSRPAQRGSDGVERPVRFAPKISRPKPQAPSGPGWNIGDGGFLASLGSALGFLLHILAYAALVAVCGLIFALAARAIAEVWRRRSQRLPQSSLATTPLAHDRSPGETSADVFLQQALTLATKRAYREALSQLLLGAMSGIERNEWIRYRRGLTVRDYLRSVRNRTVQYEGLKSVVDVYEPVEFGREPATQSMFEAALAGYRTAFQTAQL